MKERATSAIDLVRQAPEPVAAIVLGVAFSVLSLLGLADFETVAEVTLIVLSVLALSVVRDRITRRDVARRLAELDDDVRSLISGEPYYTLHYTSAMDVREQGSLAYGTRTRKVRFDQNSVLSLSDLSASTGTREAYSVEPPPLKSVGQFGAGGQNTLISLGRPWMRGEELEFTITEKLRDAFLADREDVTVNVKGPMETLVLRVTWPGDRAVGGVFIERFGRQTAVAETELKPSADGRPSYEHTFEQPQVGESISIVWDWAAPASP